MARIVHTTVRYWPGPGGSVRYVQEVAERQAAEGHHVTVLTTDAFHVELFWDPRKKRIPTRSEVHRGVHIRRFPLQHLPASRVVFPALFRLVMALADSPAARTPLPSWLGRFTPYVPELARWLQQTKEQFDFVHGIDICMTSLNEPAFSFAQRIGATFVTTPFIHLGEPNDDSVRRSYTMPHQMALALQADVVLVMTEIERQFLANHGVHAGRMVKVGVGINPQELLGGDAERFRRRYELGPLPIIFCLGAACYDKGTFHVVEAMEVLWNRGLEAELVIAGPAMDQFVTFFQARNSVTRRRTHVLGVISEEDKRDLLAAGAVLVMPSRVDSFGIVYLEAWLYKRPVVGAAAGGVSDVIADGVDGYLVRFGDAQAMADRIQRLLQDADLADRLGRAGHEKVRRSYTWDSVYPKMREAFKPASTPPP